MHITISIILMYLSFVNGYRSPTVEGRTYEYYMNDYKIKPKCEGRQLFVLLVLSHVENIEDRMNFRKYFNEKRCAFLNATVLFVIASVRPKYEKYNITQEDINNEAMEHKDILQANFIESLHNLTHKHLMGLYWVSEVCKTADFVLKVSDDYTDIMDMIPEYADYMRINQPLGFYKIMFLRAYLKKDYILKVPASDDESNDTFVEERYPQFIAGTDYFTSLDIASRLCAEAPNHRYITADDLFITGILPDVLEIPRRFFLDVVLSKFMKFDLKNFLNPSTPDPSRRKFERCKDDTCVSESIVEATSVSFEEL